MQLLLSCPKRMSTNLSLSASDLNFSAIPGLLNSTGSMISHSLLLELSTAQRVRGTSIYLGRLWWGFSIDGVTPKMYGLSIYKYWMIWGDLGGLWGTTPFRKPPYIAMYHRYCWHPVEHPHSRFVMSGVSWGGLLEPADSGTRGSKPQQRCRDSMGIHWDMKDWYPQVLKIWNGWNWGTVGKGWWWSEGLKDPCKGITIRISWGYLGLSEKIGEKKLLCIFTKDSSESSCFRVPHPLSLKPMFSNHQKWGAPNNLDAW